jgi:hypothetical protein
MILMSEKNNETEQKDQETKKKEKPSKEISIPMRATIEDMIKALGILGDKGGKARFKELVTMFGKTKSDQILLSNSLNPAVAFGLIEPHKGKSPYVISDEGKKFLSASEDERKAILFPKFLAYEGYKDVLIGMKNTADKSLKKEAITNTWMSVVGGGSVKTRKLYTLTFSSIGDWCGAIKDTGKTCSLPTKAETVLTQILQGKPVSEGAKTITQQGPAITPSQVSALGAAYCPFCTKPDIDPKTEKLLDKVISGDTTTLIIERTFHCRNCTREFTRIVQQVIRPQAYD